ncbi:hypothetical protein FNF29_04178 [Cafeteria roenbergensis]|uniref:Uncharacterized protein n=1 Tax=Cafeteria roenbergensis TaxID=33653 RepID=A0A5A8CHU8_CAFRO|nr:hypothetical protein FNF29_04178 [Cafeteria roenbergensis]|eukprot:KAA0152064.1 hypothetical protein FNF29_04178 [Cafeteria roenbergensis]
MGLSQIQNAEAEGANSAPVSSWRGLQRFYESVSVAEASPSEGTAAVAEGLSAFLTKEGEAAPAAGPRGWHVIIDGHVLKTIGLRELLLPTKAAALAIAAEFAMQDQTIMSASTPLYNLACTAVDGYLDGELDEAVARRELRPRADAALKRAAQAALDRGQTTEESGEVGTWLWPVREACEAVVAQGLDAPIGAISAVCGTSSRLAEPVLDGGMGSVYENEVGKLREMAKDYLETDTTCFRVMPGRAVADLPLRRQQDQAYNPFLDWFEAKYGTKLAVMEGFSDAEHPKNAYVAIEDFVDRADHFLLAALAALLGATKSATISLALLHQHVSLDQALSAARVEEEYQIAENGFVEDGHDTQAIQMRVKASAATAMLALIPQSRPTSTTGSFATAAHASTAPETEASSPSAMVARTRLRRLFDVAAAERRQDEAKAEFQALVKARGWDKLSPEELEQRVLEHQLETMTQEKMLSSFGASGRSD